MSRLNREKAAHEFAAAKIKLQKNKGKIHPVPLECDKISGSVHKAASLNLRSTDALIFLVDVSNAKKKTDVLSSNAKNKIDVDSLLHEKFGVACVKLKDLDKVAGYSPIRHNIFYQMNIHGILKNLSPENVFIMLYDDRLPCNS